jgi:hypothetical protein
LGQQTGPSVELWDPRTDSAPTCQEPGTQPPWYRFTDATSTWQFAVLNFLPFVALLLFGFGAFARREGRRSDSLREYQHSQLAFRATAAVGALNVLLFVLLWVA